MSQDNLETLRHTVDAFNRGAWDEARLHFDTNAKWPPAEPGGTNRSYFNYEGIQNYLRSWADNFDDFRLEVAELVDAGDRAFVAVQVSGRGRQSGVEASSPVHSLVAQFREGKILGLTMFLSREAALDAVGLTGQNTG